MTLKANNATSYITAPILWMNSNCKTYSNRTEYVLELMKYIDVDSYGKCGRNKKELPKHIAKIQGTASLDAKRSSYKWQEGKLALSSEYLFTVAIENSLSYDYITEKLWHPLLSGSVPIYLGAPNVEDWLPCESCIIDLRKFKTPKDAAHYLKMVSMNRTLYESFHQWRNVPITEKFQKILNYFQKAKAYSLDCILCDMTNRVNRGEKRYNIKSQVLKQLNFFNRSTVV
ncbi:unnamed protein product [Didymodactylos carnosus]|uniref:Fucosyltransferase n=1 Tax=Didymodactylos carnosus TaxID=1234261 RepID=A0A815XVW9_9BILA|nr:unnamed protein product [Didymodactylos carnosus]CAF1562418.1 unnamed protein product [Didymodactylos carnosus]CAF4238365.1 unnamed protein product [Didymodactylos carnosus]CAF4423982.1 unnamed protein product [Didymodactylos carnosus]